MRRIFRGSHVRPNPKRDVTDELQFHIDMRAQEFRDAGMSDADARRAAIEAFGDVATMNDQLATVRGAHVDELRRRDRLDELRADIAFAFRSFRRNPGFTAAALATLALGIGATIAVFTVVNGVLLRPLPYPDPSTLAMVWMTSTDPASPRQQLPVSSGFYLHVTETQRTFKALAAFRAWPYTLTSDGDAEQVAGSRVTPSLFTVLGVPPLLGRAFNEADAAPNAPKVVMLSHSLWQRRFGGAASIVNQPIQIGGEPFTVIGIMPEGFAFPRGAELPSAFQFGLRTELWMPMGFTAEDRTQYGTLNMAAIGRLDPGTTVSRAKADLSGNLRALLDRIAPTLKLDFQTLSIQDQAGGPVRRGLWLLMGAVGLVLFIACANVTNLLIARTASRRRELSMRAALGAGRSRIARQLITENVVLAIMGTGIGLLLSIWVTRAMLAMVPGSMPRTDDVRIDWRVALGAMAIAIIAGSTFGIMSTLQIRLGELAATLREAGSRATGGRAGGLGRRGLVTLEVALSVMLVIGAALLAVSFSRLQSVRSGIDTQGVLTSHIVLPISGGFDPLGNAPRWAQFFAEVTERASRIPGVKAVGATSALPLTRTTESGAYMVIGRPTPGSGQAPSAEYAVIEGDYFKAAGIGLVSGRVFDRRDQRSTTQVIVVNREFAKKVFGDSLALGRQIKTYFDFGVNADRTIIGIVEDTRQSGLDVAVRPMIYVPQSQMSYPGLRLVIRTEGNPLAILPALKREVNAVDARVALSRTQTLEEIHAASLASQRFSMTVLGIFAVLALVLATVGLYGVIALSVGQRQREIGVRLALGASAGNVVRQIVGEGMRMTLAGVILGLVGAYAASRLLAAMLYGVSAVNPGLYATAIVGVVVVATAATLLPARRATRVDPVTALRSD